MKMGSLTSIMSMIPGLSENLIPKGTYSYSCLLRGGGVHMNSESFKLPSLFWVY